MRALIFIPSLLLATLGVGFAAPEPLPFGNVANIALKDDIPGDGKGGWTDQGAENSLTGFPTGAVEFEGVRFLVPAGNEPAAIAFSNAHRSGMPSEVVVPASGIHGGMLYILSACAWEFLPGQEVAEITICHTDGTTQTDSFIYQKHTGSWWMPGSCEAATVAWRGRNGLGVPIGVYLTSISIHDPSRPIASIRIRAESNRGMLILLGLSISEDSSTRVQPEPLWRPEPLSTEAWHPLPPLSDTGAEPAWANNTAGFHRDRWLVAEISTPLKEVSQTDAAKIARTLRLLGYTGARLPSLETLLPPVGGPATRGVEPLARESLTHFLNALQKEGLTFQFPLGGGRSYGMDDGVAAYRHINPSLANQIIVDTKASDLMLDTAKSAEEIKPFAVALLSATMFLGDPKYLFTTPHRNRLINAWNTWLSERYGSDASLIAAWQVPGQEIPLSPGETLSRSQIDLLNIYDFTPYQERFRIRFAEQLEFLEELQSSWIARVLPEVRSVFPDALIFNTGWLLAPRVGDFQTRSAAALDGIEERLPDSHLATGPDRSPYFWNESPFRLTNHWYYRSAFNRLAGKPFVALDNAATWPGDYEFARVLLTMTVGGIQGWDGVVHRSFRRNFPEPTALGQPSGGICSNPAFLAVLPLGRNLFLRGDLTPAPVVWSRVLDSPKTQRETGYNPLPVTLQPALLAGSIQATIAGPPYKEAGLLEPLETGAVSRVESSTGQLRCDFETDRLAVATPHTLALAGSGPDSVSLAEATLESRSGYGVSYATTLDSQPLSSTKAILLGAVGRTRNSGQQVDVSTAMVGLLDRAWRLDKPGHAPVLMEPCSATLTLTGVSSGTWTIQPLNLFGQPVGPPLSPVKSEEGSLIVNFDNSHSPLYLLRHEESR